MTLTEVLVVNKMRDYAVGNTIVFAIPDQDGSVAVTFTAVAGDLGDNSIELTEFYVNSNSSQTIKIQAMVKRAKSRTRQPTPTSTTPLTCQLRPLTLRLTWLLGPEKLLPLKYRRSSALLPQRHSHLIL